MKCDCGKYPEGAKHTGLDCGPSLPHPRVTDKVKPALNHGQKHFQPGDRVTVADQDSDVLTFGTIVGPTPGGNNWWIVRTADDEPWAHESLIELAELNESEESSHA